MREFEKIAVMFGKSDGDIFMLKDAKSLNEFRILFLFKPTR